MMQSNDSQDMLDDGDANGQSSSSTLSSSRERRKRCRSSEPNNSEQQANNKKQKTTDASDGTTSASISSNDDSLAGLTHNQLIEKVKMFKREKEEAEKRAEEAQERAKALQKQMFDQKALQKIPYLTDDSPSQISSSSKLAQKHYRWASLFCHEQLLPVIEKLFICCAPIQTDFLECFEQMNQIVKASLEDCDVETNISSKLATYLFKVFTPLHSKFDCLQQYSYGVESVGGKKILQCKFDLLLFNQTSPTTTATDHSTTSTTSTDHSTIRPPVFFKFKYDRKTTSSGKQKKPNYQIDGYANGLLHNIGNHIVFGVHLRFNRAKKMLSWKLFGYIPAYVKPGVHQVWRILLDEEIANKDSVSRLMSVLNYILLLNNQNKLTLKKWVTNDLQRTRVLMKHVGSDSSRRAYKVFDRRTYPGHKSTTRDPSASLLFLEDARLECCNRDDSQQTSTTSSSSISVAASSNQVAPPAQEKTCNCSVQLLSYPWIEGSHQATHTDQLADILRCLEKIHNDKYVHGDIRGANLIFSQQKGKSKIIDFDFAKKLDQNSPPKYPEGYNYELADTRRHRLAREECEMKQEHDRHSLAWIFENFYRPKCDDKCDDHTTTSSSSSSSAKESKFIYIVGLIKKNTPLCEIVTQMDDIQCGLELKKQLDCSTGTNQGTGSPTKKNPTNNDGSLVQNQSSKTTSGE